MFFSSTELYTRMCRIWRVRERKTREFCRICLNQSSRDNEINFQHKKKCYNEWSAVKRGVLVKINFNFCIVSLAPRVKFSGRLASLARRRVEIFPPGQSTALSSHPRWQQSQGLKLNSMLAMRVKSEKKSIKFPFLLHFFTSHLSSSLSCDVAHLALLNKEKKVVMKYGI